MAKAGAKTAGLPVEAGSGDLEVGDGWLEDFTPYLLYCVVNRLNNRLLARLKSLEVSPSQWRVLSVLRSHGTLTISRIVEYTLLEQSNASRVIDQLEKDDLARRRPVADNLRMTEVVLTPEGVAMFERILPAARRHEKIAMEGFTAREIATLRSYLVRLENNITMDDR